jgi:hypothetical protein
VNENAVNENAVNENAMNENAGNENAMNENAVNENAVNENIWLRVQLPGNRSHGTRSTKVKHIRRSKQVQAALDASGWT